MPNEKDPKRIPPSRSGDERGFDASSRESKEGTQSERSKSNEGLSAKSDEDDED